MTLHSLLTNFILVLSWEPHHSSMHHDGGHERSHASKFKDETLQSHIVFNHI